jgi:hypothetical protein
LSKRTTPAKSAAAKRAAFAGQRQQFAAMGRAKGYSNAQEKRATRECLESMKGLGVTFDFAWTAL